MKKYIYLAVAAVAVLSSCEKKNDPVATPPVFTAIIEGEDASAGAARRTTLVDGKKVHWESTDLVCINGGRYAVAPGAEDATTATLTYMSGDTLPKPYRACYPESMASVSGSNVTFSLPATYTYEEGKFNMPLYACSENTTLAFKNICGVLAIRVTSDEMSRVTKIIITANKALCGPCTIKDTDSDGRYYATATGTAEANKSVTLDCGEGVTPSAEGTVFYIPVPVLYGAQLQIAVQGEMNSEKKAGYQNMISSQAMYTKNKVSVARNKIYPIDFKTSLATFSVSANKKVHFTRGNLYWNGSGFAFEESQTAYPKQWDTHHVGHFYWTKTAAASYAETYSDGTSTTSDKFWLDGSDESHRLTVGGISGLYVLSDAEWQYLIYTRTNASKLYKNSVTVAGHTDCFVIAPDGFAGAIRSSYSVDEWAVAEAMGLVCLRAAELRNGTVFVSGGDYWSSTSVSGNAGQAMCFHFVPSQYITSNYIELTNILRSYGCSIRAIRTAN